MGEGSEDQESAAGMLVRLHQQEFCMLLSAMHKIYELLLWNKTKRDSARCAALSFTETWLSNQWTISPKVQFISYRSPKRSIRKDDTWWNFLHEACRADVMVLGKHCSPNLESLFSKLQAMFTMFTLHSFWSVFTFQLKLTRVTHCRFLSIKLLSQNTNYQTHCSLL